MTMHRRSFLRSSVSALFGTSTSLLGNGGGLVGDVFGGTTVYVDPSQGANGTGTLASPFNTWASVTFVAGTVYAQRCGTSQTISPTITATGTASAPIILSSYGPGPAGSWAPPAIVGQVSINSSAYVTLSGYAISSGSTSVPAVNIGSGNNITVTGCVLTGSQFGVYVGGGYPHFIKNNTCSGNYYGIGTGQYAATAGSPITISGNTVFGNSSHGIELEGNYAIVTGNTVHDNCLTVTTSSGIHIFGGGTGGSTGTASGFGNYNTITNNASYSNRDPGDGSYATDGSGIESDQFCVGNTISNNLCWNNDGAGIMIYDSGSNTVTNNVLIGNCVNRSGLIDFDYELAINSALTPDLSTGNTFTGNLALGTSTIRQVCRVDDVTSTLTNGGNNTFSGNYFESLAGITPMMWDSVSYTVTAWNAIAVTPAHADFGSGVASSGLYTVTASPPGMAFVFPGGVTATIDGTLRTLRGWNPSTGLYVT